MRIILNGLGAVLILFGAVWLLQGLNVLPGSVMTGQIKWAVYGSIAIVVGVALVASGRRQRQRPPRVR